MILCFLLLLPGPLLFAQSVRTASRPGDDLTLKVAVIGPGDELYFWWGHIGLVVEDRTTDTARFYDWGVFSFENENFFVNFAFGRLIYSCMVSWAEQNYNNYVRTNRDITLYTLDLPAEKKMEVMRFAENNMLPENRDYEYHHFRDNCATRIRDIIDLALDGQFKEAFGEEPSPFTLRQHVERHTWFNPFFDWILSFWMGQGIDRPITVWDDMFLPSEIGRRIMEFHYSDPDGRDRALVNSVEVINTAVGRPLVLEAPRLQWPRMLFASLILSINIVLFFLLFKKMKCFKPAFGIFQGIIGLFFGIAGSMLFFMTLFTDHDYTYYNSNILFVNPLFLLLIPLSLFYGFTKNEKKQLIASQLIKAFWVYIFLGALLTMLIKLFPLFYQQNQATQALLMPIALAMIYIFSGQDWKTVFLSIFRRKK